MSAQTIHVTIFEDNKDLREGMQQILNASPGFSCAGAYANCNNMLKRLHADDPDVVLMDKLLEAIKEVAEGGSPMTPSIAAKVLKMFKDQNPKANTGSNFDLSVREKEILVLLVDGLSYKLIADKLFISYETVHSHIKNIYQKLHVNSVNEAISKALRNRLT